MRPAQQVDDGAVVERGVVPDVGLVQQSEILVEETGGGRIGPNRSSHLQGRHDLDVQRKVGCFGVSGQLDRHAAALPAEVAADECDRDALRDVVFEQVFVVRDVHIRISHAELVEHVACAGSAVVGVLEDFASVLRNCDDGATALARQHADQAAKVGRVLHAERSRQMRFEADDERRRAQRNAIEGMNEIESPWRQGIEYGGGFDFLRNPVERHEAAPRDNVLGSAGTIERPGVACGRQNAELLHNPKSIPWGVGWLEGSNAPASPELPLWQL